MPRLTGSGRWRRVGATVLDPVLTERAGPGVVVDCRSATYAAAWRPAGEVARRTVAVRAFTETAGRRTIVSHWAKHTRGQVARWLLEAPAYAQTVAAVARIVGQHARCELVDLGRAGWALDLILAPGNTAPRAAHGEERPGSSWCGSGLNALPVSASSLNMTCSPT